MFHVSKSVPISVGHSGSESVVHPPQFTPNKYRQTPWTISGVSPIAGYGSGVHDTSGLRACECSTRPERLSNAETMKILLQHIRTRLYVCAPGGWAEDVHLAIDFEHSKKAFDFAKQHRLSEVQLAVRCIDSEFDENFPLSAASPHALPGRR